MRYRHFGAVAVLVAVCLSAGTTFGQPVRGPHQVGIPAVEMDFVAADQWNSQWCWAAAIQMVFGYYGVAITQQQIVARSYGTDLWGNLPDWPGSFEVITRNLNNWSIDNYGQQYTVGAHLHWGAPPPMVLIEELRNGRPMLIAYQSSPVSGHAVVLTAATFSQTAYGPVIHSVVVRDPWPSPENVFNRGRVVHDGQSLAAVIQAYWRISVVKPRLGQSRQERGVEPANGEVVGGLTSIVASPPKAGETFSWTTQQPRQIVQLQ